MGYVVHGIHNLHGCLAKQDIDRMRQSIRLGDIFYYPRLVKDRRSANVLVERWEKVHVIGIYSALVEVIGPGPRAAAADDHLSGGADRAEGLGKEKEIMSVMNYTTKIPAYKTVTEVEYMLMQHGASAIMKTFEDGRINGLTFALPVNGQNIPVKLPVRIPQVLAALQKEKREHPKKNVTVTMEQAEMVAWRQVKDWIEAQMQMVDLQQMEMVQIFLQGIQDKNYDRYQSTGSQPAEERQSTGSQPATIEERKESNNIINNKNHNVSSPTSGDRPAYPYEDIVDYLNMKAGTHFRYSSEDTKKHIRARINDGYTVEDFKVVIDKKVAEWKGTPQGKFLRPYTLFGTKFESYLNEQPVECMQRKEINNRFHNFDQRETDYDAMVANKLKERLREN